MSPKFTMDAEASSFRKIAAAMWLPPRDPTIYGTLDLDATELLRTIERLRAETGLRITITHLVARAIAIAFTKHPETNAKVRFWGRIERRDSVDLFLQVAVEGGQDLSGVRIDNADRKGAVELAREIGEKARRIRSNDDPEYAKSRGLFRRLSWFFVRPLLRISDFLVNELHLDLGRFGMPMDPFGTAMITNVGMFGVDTAFAPLTPIARCAMLVLVAEVRDRPWVVEKRVEVRPVLRLCATFDHRIIDGAHAGKLGAAVTQALGDPAKLAEAPQPALPAPAPAPAPASSAP